ncbi:hypothetical protein KR51_00008040 [Rubidibacter lacunae KORDI 51-2]|uniref:Uncharacterized protein n=1 Tax=Rubidibacter lacunae KORDI 51-2 TaxID=582515 RepID=U5DS25_9CHRO|nr:hypothetical protein KR51_00008040 [Rubidibacter lacunae KORDI 51-2]
MGNSLNICDASTFDGDGSSGLNIGFPHRTHHCPRADLQLGLSSNSKT